MAGLYGLDAGQAKPNGGAAASAGVATATTDARFGADVIAESARQPVLVDFWAPWCEPCKQLTPVLEKAVEKAGGKVKLVTLNIDEHPEIAGRLGVRSIPAVIAFQRAQPVDGFMGALPESEVRGFIERLVGPIGGAEDLLAEAQALLDAGDAVAAAELYAAFLEENPGDPEALAGLAKLHVETGDLEAARNILDLAPAGADQHPGLLAARAAIALAEQAAEVGDLAGLKRKSEADPSDHQARFDYAIALNAHNLREEAAARCSKSSGVTGASTTTPPASNCCNFSRRGASPTPRRSPRASGFRQCCSPDRRRVLRRRRAGPFVPAGA